MGTYIIYGAWALRHFLLFESTTHFEKSTALCQWEALNMHIINDWKTEGVGEMNQSS